MKIVHFGAGNIGRGAIPEIFDGIYDHLTFVDPNQVIVDKINKSVSYKILKTKPIIVQNYSAININDTNNLYQSIKNCDLISTSCGFNNLESVAKIINQVQVNKKVFIICFENNIRPTSHLKQFIKNKTSFEFIDCIIDRIVPNQANDTIDVLVEDYLSVVIEKNNCNLDYFKNCQKVDKLDEYIKLKLFGVNGLHFVLSILGHNANCKYVQDAFNNAQIIVNVNFWIECLVKYFQASTKIDKNFLKKYLNENLKRFANPILFDECKRVARNSIEKLKFDNRIIPVVKSCLNDENESIQTKQTMIGLIKQLFSYNNENDNDSQIIHASIETIGINATVEKYSKLKI